MKKYLADYHVHTEFSDDSVCPMEEMVEKGIEIGLDAGMNEHVAKPYNPNTLYTMMAKYLNN